jgi:hypothetical protein
MRVSASQTHIHMLKVQGEVKLLSHYCGLTVDSSAAHSDSISLKMVCTF